jgi:zinc and cadmium transporter
MVLPSLVLWVLGSVTVVSLVSLVGAVTFAISLDRLRQHLLVLISFSAGALLGDVFFHLIPELQEVGYTTMVGGWILAGILLFFVLERLILWHHSHTEHDESVHAASYLVILGDGMHNFIDGLVIAAGFLVSVPVGVATTIAVIAHEVPHELGNFAILIHGGWSRGKALWYNFLSALPAIVGAVVALLLADLVPLISHLLLAFGVASFIYIAMSDIIPELHKARGFRLTLWQLIGLVLGMASMAALLLLE